jgi:hypothetical protein
LFFAANKEEQIKRQNGKVERRCGFALCLLRFAF